MVINAMDSSWQHSDTRARIKASKQKAANQEAALRAEESQRMGTERAMAGERSEIMDILKTAATGGDQTIGLTPEQQEAAKFLTDVMRGETLPIDKQTKAAMLAQAQDPMAAEYGAAQSYLGNLYGGRGFGTGGGGQAESLQRLRMGTLQEQGRAGQNVLVAAANANMGARLNAANTQATLGNQNAGLRAAALGNLTNFAASYPITNLQSFTPKVNVPITSQPSQNAVQF